MKHAQYDQECLLKSIWYHVDFRFVTHEQSWDDELFLRRNSLVQPREFMQYNTIQYKCYFYITFKTTAVSSIITYSHTNKMKHKNSNLIALIHFESSTKRYDLNLDLKESSDGEGLICIGRGFHNRGAATETALSPFVFNLVLRTWRIIEDLKFLVFDKESKFNIYFGAMLCNSFKRHQQNLKFQFKLLQASSVKKPRLGVILSLLCASQKSGSTILY